MTPETKPLPCPCCNGESAIMGGSVMIDLNVCCKSCDLMLECTWDDLPSEVQTKLRSANRTDEEWREARKQLAEIAIAKWNRRPHSGQTPAGVREAAKAAEADILRCFYVRHVVNGEPQHDTPPTIQDGELRWHIERAFSGMAWRPGEAAAPVTTGWRPIETAPKDRAKTVEELVTEVSSLSVQLLDSSFLLTASEARVKELEEMLRDTIELADEAMKRANRDGAEYNRTEDLADARSALGVKP